MLANFVASNYQHSESFFRGAFIPNALKCAMITPLLKKSNLDPEEFKNFRPVSNLPLTHISLQYHR